MLYDGKFDTLTACFLSSIKWQIAYNTLRGETLDTPLFRYVVPGAQPNEEGLYPIEGAFCIKSSPIAGNQKTCFYWCADEGKILFYIDLVSAPNYKLN